MGFDGSRWTRMQSEGVGVYVRGDRPSWFVPNRSGDEFLRDLERTGLPADSSPAAIRFLSREEQTACVRCGHTLPANALCENGHFVCDACHAADAPGNVEESCLASTETDMIALFNTLRAEAGVPLHGPEHHAMVPGVILATYRNLGGPITEEQIRTGIRRGMRITGGTCGFLGACGAPLGAGAAVSLILDANPLKPRERQLGQTIVAEIMAELASFTAARGCRREALLTFRRLPTLSREHLPIALRAEAPSACDQWRMSTECIRNQCPFFPAGPAGDPA